MPVDGWTTRIKDALKRAGILSPLIECRRGLIARSYQARRDRLDRLITRKGQAASDAIKEELASGKPLFVGRFGSCELGLVASYFRGRGKMSFLDNTFARILAEKGGFYPLTDDSIARFAEIYRSLMSDIDILGSWCPEELEFRRELSKSMKISLADIEPYGHADPWTSALRGRRVLVVNPLAETIKAQYAKRRSLFKNESILPEFTLLTYKSVYEFNNEDRSHESWFAALDEMKREIALLDFDVAVLGCGPFGMPLASFIKQGGKQAIVMGGATQIWFGIRGARWDGEPFFKGLYNENWVYPSSAETPKNAGTLEGGCYWGSGGAGS